MKKIKDWLRLKLKKFLDIEDLELNLEGYTKSTNKELNNLFNSIDYTKQNLNVIYKNLKNDIGHFQ